MIKVSVIVPVYNAKRYLKECLDSVLAQTLKEIEVICVDDGSTDGSSHILDMYAMNWENMIVIHKENGGVVSARKAGEAVASGEYIGYVDSDDWIDDTMYENLYTQAVNSRADMVTSGYYLEGNYTSQIFDGPDAGLYEGEAMRFLRDNTIYCMRKKGTGIRGVIWCKLFSRELMAKLYVPDDLSMGEDKLQVLSSVLECRSILVLKEAYYHYRINTESVTHTGNSSYLLCVDKIYHNLRKLYTHPNYTKKMEIQTELYIMELLLAGMNTRMGFEIRNLLWFDPYWLDRIPEGSKVVLYGGGEAGRKCRRQLLTKGRHFYMGCVDFECGGYNDEDMLIQFPQELKMEDYDYIVITIKNPEKAYQIRKQLEKIGIESHKILWFEQKEIFWKFAEAEGLLDEEKKNA